MYRNCSTEKGAQRQRQLAECLLELMKTEDYTQITIGDICDRAGVSRKSFYRYFTSKDGCLHALVDQLLFGAESFCMPDIGVQRTFRQIFERFFIYWQQQADIVDALYKNDMINCLVERMMLYLVEKEHGIQYHSGPGGDDTYEGILFVLTGAMGLVINRHLTGYQKSAGQMAEIMDKLVKYE